MTAEGAATAIIKDAAEALLQWSDMPGPTLTCSEAEALADLIRLAKGDEVAAEFIRRHAEDDEPGDQHYAGPEQDGEGP